ncbi:MAG: hypothetical protein NVV70_01380 [Cellulomonas sp.]|uniref:Uncharacterized protein n=1 Tax=Cellulomonas gelida TaxID=1712 RepID=A0A4Y3KHI7_9CELL|nr:MULTISPECIES: hypothetical protein [Cellulomonas]MCR6646850.1 hypothetical protein [Cellulomonas sp.]MCR6706353.1 hypothetical protein [Cellulomonas sp.]GEA83126.1 hypothetical protein CGE01nite_03770 [Cellulomonas gelida]GGL29970.1 hypothetical protein GCM10009774_20410 [Cellulomonas gelida]
MRMDEVMRAVPALARSVESADRVPGLAGVLAIVGVIAIGAFMIARNSRPHPTREDLPSVVLDLEERGYLEIEAFFERGAPDWLLHRRRLPDRNLSEHETGWYFAIFGTRLAASVAWSQVRPPHSPHPTG